MLSLNISGLNKAGTNIPFWVMVCGLLLSTYWLRRWQRLNFMPCIIIVCGRCVVCKCKMCWKVRSHQYGQACSSSAALQALQIKTSQFKKQDSSHSTSDFLMSHTAQVTTWWAAAKMAAKVLFFGSWFQLLQTLGCGWILTSYLHWGQVILRTRANIDWLKKFGGNQTLMVNFHALPAVCCVYC